MSTEALFRAAAVATIKVRPKGMKRTFTKRTTTPDTSTGGVEHPGVSETVQAWSAPFMKTVTRPDGSRVTESRLIIEDAFVGKLDDSWRAQMVPGDDASDRKLMDPVVLHPGHFVTGISDG